MPQLCKYCRVNPEQRMPSPMDAPMCLACKAKFDDWEAEQKLLPVWPCRCKGTDPIENMPPVLEHHEHVVVKCNGQNIELPLFS
jgi:hypothetical protein